MEMEGAALKRRLTPQRYVALTCGAALLLFAFLVLASVGTEAPRRMDFLVAGLLFAACWLLQIGPLTLPWRRQRIAIHPDEAAVVVAFYFGDPVLSALAVPLAMSASQAILRKPPIKVFFNTAMTACSAGAAALAFETTVAASGSVLAGALISPLVLAAVSQLLVAGLLSTLDGARNESLARPALAKSILLQGAAGAALGGLAIGLYHLHPLWPLLLLPVGYLGHRILAAAYLHEMELETRRILGQVSERLVGESSDAAIVEAIHGVCAAAFDLRRFEVHLEREGAAAWEWVRAMGSTQGATRLETHLFPTSSGRAGSLVLDVGFRGARKRREDQELVKMIGGYLSMALGGAAALRAAQDAEARLRQAFDAAQDAIAVIGEDGRVAYTNSHAAAALGLRVGQRPALAGCMEKEAAQSLDLALRSGGRIPPLLEVRDQGTSLRRMYEFGVSPFSLGAQQPGALLVGRDVTERVELEAEAARHRETAARNERLSALGTLVAGVAHEVNNPLSYIQCNLEMAIADIEDASAPAGDSRQLDLPHLHEELSSAMRGVQRVSRIAEALSVLARQRRVEHPTPFSLNRAIHDIQALMQTQAPPGVLVELDLDAGDPQVAGIPGEIQQAILHLAKNAAEAAAEGGGRVVVRTRSRDGRAVVEVIDNGPGIPESERTHLFNPFYTTKPDGTGLGLSLVHRVVRDHAGDVEFAEAPGGGAVFALSFALAPSALA